METVEKNIWRMEVDAFVPQDEENIRTQTVILKANDVEEAVERAVGRLALNYGAFIRIAGVRGEIHKDDSRT
jgi:hypothetical protein